MCKWKQKRVASKEGEIVIVSLWSKIDKRRVDSREIKNKRNKQKNEAQGHLFNLITTGLSLFP